MSKDIVCTIDYPGGDKKFRVYLDSQKTPLDLMREFQPQIVQNQNKITFYFKQVVLNPNVPFLDQNIKDEDTILMNVEAEGG
ncbi:unnamed protein product [Paramecium octaurelia]|uniref:Rad60/SUMO-like domain-containing protein n=1 Tax=Paramecium octaurelia TaxID=43137 RepID=A0A8S1UI45_PAROT|nr:unnamed protein product [Paramecium octaurelia]